jgi:hypothetical protein
MGFNVRHKLMISVSNARIETIPIGRTGSFETCRLVTDASGAYMLGITLKT